MMLQIEMGPDFPKVTSELGSMGRVVLDASSQGLREGVEHIAPNNIITNYLSGQYLKRRTGMLARAVKGWMLARFEGVVGVREGSAVSKYAWLLGDEEKTIVPKRSDFLAIPIGEALTGAGAIKGKYSGGLRSITEGFFVNTGDQLLFGYKRGSSKRSKFRALFVLVKSVFVQGTGALYDGVDTSLDHITRQMQSEIDKVVD